MSIDKIGIAWVVAALAPWAVSPHPNFSQSVVRPASVLALVTERRYKREQERIVASLTQFSEAQRDLIENAEYSLWASSIESAEARLWEISTSQLLQPGARVAAALYASAASSELDRASYAAQRLMDLSSDLERQYFVDESDSGSFRLLLAAISQQRTLRLIDMQQVEAATLEARRLLTVTPDSRVQSYAVFEVSQGISWKSRRVQSDLAAAIRVHGHRALANLDFEDSESWVAAIRSRPAWSDVRASWVEAERDATELRYGFEARFASSSRSRDSIRTEAQLTGYEAVLLAELGGDVNRARRVRESQGKLVLLSQNAGAERVGEGLRLLRQARAEDALKSASVRIRDEGPAQALVDQAQTVINRAERDGWLSESDMVVLSAGADFLDRSWRRRAVLVTLAALDGEPTARRGWAFHDRVWSAIASLVADSGADAAVLQRLTWFLDRDDYLTQPLSRTISGVIDELEWESTDLPDRLRWEAWAKNTPVEADTREVARTVQEKIFGAPIVPGDDGMDLAVHFADLGVLDSSRVESVHAFLVERLDREAQDARELRISLGGYSTSNVAVAVALRSDSERLWSAILSFVTDRDVDAILKREALDRLTRSAASIPSWVRKTLVESADSILASRQRDHFIAPSEPLPVFVEAFRLLAILGGLDARFLIDVVMQLVAGSPRARVEAARSIPYTMGHVDATWAQSLLMVLSQDEDPVVKGEAAGGLILASDYTSPLSDSVVSRVGELFLADGLRTPAVMLYAVQRLANARPRAAEQFRPYVSRFTGDGVPRLLRAIAIQVWASIDEPRASY